MPIYLDSPDPTDLSTLPVRSPQSNQSLAQMGTAIQPQPQSVPIEQQLQQTNPAPLSPQGEQQNAMAGMNVQPTGNADVVKSKLGNFFSHALGQLENRFGIPTQEQLNQNEQIRQANLAHTAAITDYSHALAQQLRSGLSEAPLAPEEAEILGLPPGMMVAPKQKQALMLQAMRFRSQAAYAPPKTVPTPMGAFAWDAKTRKWQKIEGSEGLMHTLDPGEAEDLGIDPKTQAIPVKIWKDLVTNRLAGTQVVQGTYDQFPYNRLTGEVGDPLGIGNPREIFNPARRYGVYTDPATGLNFTATFGEGTAKHYIAANTNLEKTGFIPAARFADVQRAVDYTNKYLPANDAGMGQKALMANALSDADYMKLGAVNAFRNSYLQTLMTDETKNYVVGILSLREQIMGMQALLTGTSQLSDARLIAIWNTLPATEGNSEMARLKMTQAQQMIANLRQAYPQMEAVTNAQQKKTGAGGPAPDGTRIKVGNGYQVKRGGKWVPE